MGSNPTSDTVKIYKIRHKKTGKFSATSSWHGKIFFTVKGRVFTRLDFLHTHVHCMRAHDRKCYDDCEIVEYEIEETRTFDLA